MADVPRRAPKPRPAVRAGAYGSRSICCTRGHRVVIKFHFTARLMKSRLLKDGQEKTFAVVFEAGEEVVAGLLKFATEHKLAGAHLTAIGAFERVTLGFFEPANRDYKKIAIHEQVELMSLVGNIARDDKGDPKLHAHVVVGKSDGTAHGGHLLDAYVRPTLEVVVIESSQHLRRRMRGEFGLALLDLSS
jgi:predicted DNA-binding protein with PD1-like motif